MPSNWELQVITHLLSDRFQEAVQLGAAGDHSSFFLIVFRKPSNWELRVITHLLF
jgi:hypothetical protein